MTESGIGTAEISAWLQVPGIWYEISVGCYVSFAGLIILTSFGRTPSAMETTEVKLEDGEALAALRVLAMRESLEAIGRFDPVRARTRFLSGFDPEVTRKVVIAGKLAAFYVLKEEPDFLYLDHLYVHPDFQSEKLGSKLLSVIVRAGYDSGKVIRLGALKGSRANEFYLSHGFVKTHDEEFDNYYELKIG